MDSNHRSLGRAAPISRRRVASPKKNGCGAIRPGSLPIPRGRRRRCPGVCRPGRVVARHLLGPHLDCGETDRSAPLYSLRGPRLIEDQPAVLRAEPGSSSHLTLCWRKPEFEPSVPRDGSSASAISPPCWSASACLTRGAAYRGTRCGAIRRGSLPMPQRLRRRSSRCLPPRPCRGAASFRSTPGLR